MPFKDLVGHRRASALLARAITAQRLPPSLLFTGPDGVGKRTTARVVAEALNCLSPRTGGTHDLDACGVCGACRRIARNAHPEIITITPGDTGRITVDAVRNVVDQTAYRPFEGRKRVVIVDDAETMLAPAQSALLKTLEEPAVSSVFVLVTSTPDLLLPTVRSRCAHLRFGRLTTAEVAGVLTSACGMKPAEARQAAPLGEGSVAHALQVQARDGAASRVTARGVLTASARARDDRQRLALTKDLAPKESGQSSADGRDQLAGRLRAMATLLRDVAVLNSRADTRMLANADLESELGELTRSFDNVRAVRAFTAVDRALGALERNASPKAVAGWLVLQI